MSKSALVVGINRYDNYEDLCCCVDDAKAMVDRLSSHADGAGNYDCLALTSDTKRVTEDLLRDKVAELLNDFRGGDAIFYFSGHGLATDEGAYLVTQDAREGDRGYPMAELLAEANKSGVNSILLILDCCHSGSMGNSSNEGGEPLSTLAEGVTILAASTALQESQEGLEHSVFTGLVLNALDGGAANVRGHVSAAAVYGFVEQSLGTWQQRPMYKSHARKLRPIRKCQPAVPDATLRRLPELFRSPQTEFSMDPSFEYTSKEADQDNVAKFDLFKTLRNANLLTTDEGLDLYFVALQSKHVRLTPLGKFYWRLAKDRRL